MSTAARSLAEVPPLSRLRFFVAVRHRFAEDVVAAAVARGVRQVVVLGAGLDTFAYRHPHEGLRVYEVDFPATGAWKRERLRRGGDRGPGLGDRTSASTSSATT